jgi:hypothetical protein
LLPQRSGKMKIAIIARLFTKWNVYIDASQWFMILIAIQFVFLRSILCPSNKK